MTNKEIIGIDLGTTTTLVTFCNGNDSQLLNIEHNNHIKDTVIRLSKPILQKENEIEDTGESAWNNRRHFPKRTFFNFKPEIGETESSNKLAFLWLQTTYKIIKARLNNTDISKYEVIIGIPAKWDKEKQNNYKKLAEKAGFKNINFIPEPIAAMLYAKFYENIAVVVKLPEGEYITRNVNGKRLKIYNAQTILDTVSGKTLTKGSLKLPFVYRTIIEGELAISKPYPSLLRGNPIVVIMVPIRKDDKLLGGLVLAIKLSYFIEKYIQMAAQNKSSFFVTKKDAEGKDVVQPSLTVKSEVQQNARTEFKNALIDSGMNESKATAKADDLMSLLLNAAKKQAGSQDKADAAVKDDLIKTVAPRTAMSAVQDAFYQKYNIQEVRAPETYASMKNFRTSIATALVQDNALVGKSLQQSNSMLSTGIARWGVDPYQALAGQQQLGHLYFKRIKEGRMDPSILKNDKQAGGIQAAMISAGYSYKDWAPYTRRILGKDQQEIFKQLSKSDKQASEFNITGFDKSGADAADKWNTGVSKMTGGMNSLSGGINGLTAAINGLATLLGATNINKAQPGSAAQDLIDASNKEAEAAIEAEKKAREEKEIIKSESTNKK